MQKMLGGIKVKLATNLSALVQDKALAVYSRLSPTNALEYDKLKEALLKRFQLTEEGFRTKFRSSRPAVSETAPQFVVRLEDYLTWWINYQISIVLKISSCVNSSCSPLVRT